MAESEAHRVLRFWEGFFATPLQPGTVVVPHAALAGYSGVWFFVRDDACVVSVPPDWLAHLEGALSKATIDSVLSEPGLRAVFGDAFERSIGPTWLGWLPPKAFRPVEHEAVRPADAAALARLREAADETQWQAANLGEEDAVAWFEDDEVLAAASLRAWGEGVWAPGVLSRRSGCGRAVVSAACAGAIARGDLVLYQTLRANEPAVKLARALGFAFDASHVAVRLRGGPER